MVTMPSVAIELNPRTVIVEAAPTEVAGNATDAPADDTGSVENKVRAYFKDIPIMVRVAYCESHFEHTNPETGTIIRGRINPKDVGVMQINEYYHQATANKLHLDLHSLDGNMAYARYLYEREGTQPWSASQRCWRSGNSLAMR